ncbi:MAG: putative DNA binding domain-containing protein [Nitrospira sp.]|nr:putative DNA binding domain-containing protein [Nitrospira sp.]
MTQLELQTLLNELRSLSDETEWLEFKVNRYVPQEIGEYISALSNAACLHGQQYGYLIFGIEDNTHNVIGTKFKPRKTKEGNEELENWLSRLLSPRIDFIIYEFDYDNKPVVLFKIDASHNIPVKFKGIAYIRVGTYKKKLADYPEKERKIWAKKRDVDWSAHICEEATINDLDIEAIAVAKTAFKDRNRNRPFAAEIDNWDTVTFLERAKIIRQGKMTNTAIILLGRSESSHFLSPSYAQITWKLEDKEIAYEHFGPPFYLNVNKIYQKIRNTVYKILPQDMLIPIEINKYEQWVVLEALNNCIAHQDYTLCSRIIVTERPDELFFTNAGDFFEGDVDDYTTGDKTPQKYRNSFLSHAMFNLGMIDTMGYGIHKMFQKQRERYFPLPEYDLSSPQKVSLKIYGHIIDEQYTRLLMDRTDIDLKTVILLDKVQKHQKITKDAVSYLRKNHLVEGRYPNFYIAAHIAAITGDRSSYIKNRPFDNKHYKMMILDFIKKFGSASRQDINSLLMNKLPDVLSEKQKKNKINNLLSELARKDKAIKNSGSDRNSSWVLT